MTVGQNNTLNYKEQGGERTVIGGSIDIISGGDLDVKSGAAIKIAGTAITSSAAELNTLASSGISQADLIKLAAVTAAAAELNILDGVTATAAEINQLDRSAKAVLFDDFLGDTLNSFLWTAAVGSDGQAVAAAIPATPLQSGAITMTAADAGSSDAADLASLCGALNFMPNQGGMVLEVKLHVDDITNVSFFVGFTDIVANSAPSPSVGIEMPFSLSGTTLTSNATNAIGFLFDTAATSDKIWLCSVADNADGTEVDSDIAPVNGIYITLRVEIDAAGLATYYINGVSKGTQAAPASKIDVALCPYVGVVSRTTAVRVLTVDYVHAEQSR